MAVGLDSGTQEYLAAKLGASEADKVNSLLVEIKAKMGGSYLGASLPDATSVAFTSGNFAGVDASRSLIT